MSESIWNEAGVFIAKNGDKTEEETMEAVATKFKEVKKINTDYIIDSDDDIASENDAENNSPKNSSLNDSEIEILVNLGLDPKVTRIEDLLESDLQELEDKLSNFELEDDDF
jgi:hypothetical protein